MFVVAVYDHPLDEDSSGVVRFEGREEFASWLRNNPPTFTVLHAEPTDQEQES